jgi:AraC-like DNA-binding protein
MGLQQFLPSEILRPYIKFHWIYSTDKDTSTDVIYPSGCVELAINISDGQVTTILNDRAIKMPSVEVLGQLTIPGRIIATKGSTLLVTRFYPYAVSLFFPNHVSEFTNDSIDLNEIFKNEATELYHRMMEQRTIDQKINMLEAFLIQKLKKGRSEEKLRLVEHICNQPFDCDILHVEDLASKYGFSERYIQKLFTDFIGISPKSFFNIQRFNRSLELVRSSGSSLTAIAHECGYYDQAHFIKEFKNFTGMTPSQVQ